MKPEPKPRIIIDTREQDPLPILYPTIRAGLDSGDYSIAGAETIFSIERKSIADLVACCVGGNRERFERELIRLRGYWFARLLIIGVPAEISTHRYRSNINPKSVLHTLAAFEARYIPVVWASTAEDGARLVEKWSFWFARELLKIDQSQFVQPTAAVDSVAS